jgi:hypothetical protein
LTRPKTPPERERFIDLVWQDSIQGHNAADIARRHNLDRKTVGRYLQKARERWRAENPDPAQRVVDSHWKAVQRCWQELENGRPSPNAVAQLTLSIRSNLDSVSSIEGIKALSKSTSESQRRDYLNSLDIEVLSSAEIHAFELFFEKLTGGFEGDVVDEIVRRYNAGILDDRDYHYENDGEDLLEIEPPEENGEVIDD